MSVLTSTFNCMTGQPDGLAKHIHVELIKPFTRKEIKDLYELCYIPFYVTGSVRPLQAATSLAVTFGPDIVSNVLETIPGTAIDRMNPVPKTAAVRKLLEEDPNLKFFLGKMYDWLNIDPATAVLTPLGRMS